VRSLFGGGGSGGSVANATLLIGLPDAGKTALFQQVRAALQSTRCVCLVSVQPVPTSELFCDAVQLQFGRMRQTLTSMTENKCSVGDRAVPLIDVHGHPRLRESIRGKYAKQAKRVVFVIDSKEFKDTSRETAECVALALSVFTCTATKRLFRMGQVCV